MDRIPNRVCAECSLSLRIPETSTSVSETFSGIPIGLPSYLSVPAQTSPAALSSGQTASRRARAIQRLEGETRFEDVA